MFARAFPTTPHSLSRPLRTAHLRDCCAARLPPRRGRSPSSPPLARFSRFSLTPPASFLASPLSASAPLRTALLAAARLLLSASSLLRLFTRAFHSRSFATPRSLFKEACLACSFCSFFLALGSLLLSLSFALSLRSALLCFAFASLSCLAFSLSLFLFVSRPPLSSGLDTPSTKG